MFPYHWQSGEPGDSQTHDVVFMVMKFKFNKFAPPSRCYWCDLVKSWVFLSLTALMFCTFNIGFDDR